MVLEVVFEVVSGHFGEQEGGVGLNRGGHVETGLGVLRGAQARLGEAEAYVGDKEIVVYLDGCGETAGGVNKTVQVEMMGTEADDGLEKIRMYLQGLVEMVESLLVLACLGI